jgi:hypothetical protein
MPFTTNEIDVKRENAFFYNGCRVNKEIIFT